MKKVISAAQAAALVRDGEILSVSSASGLGCPDEVLAAIGERFDVEGAPRNLTAPCPIAAGDMYGIRGIDHLAKQGLLARILAGSVPSDPSSLPVPSIWQMVMDNQVEAYNIPSGILFDMHSGAAAPGDARPRSQNDQHADGWGLKCEQLLWCAVRSSRSGCWLRRS